MTLNHINLAVTDVDLAGTILESYLGLPKTGGNSGMGFMIDGTGFVLTVMKTNKDVSVTYPGIFNIDFLVEDRSTVDQVNQQLRDVGFDVSRPSQDHVYNFDVQSVAGFT